jgi:hypothetical protein
MFLFITQLEDLEDQGDKETRDGQELVIAWSLFFTGHFVAGFRESFTPNNGIKFQVLRVCGVSKGRLALFHCDQGQYA